MAEANISRQGLLEALAGLELQRETQTGNEAWQRALSTAITALLEKLAEVQRQPIPADEGQHLAVLVADLSGFTALSEGVDAERVREALNAMWQELDSAVLAWGGTINQHAGDSMVALFGLPRPRPKDTSRALQAALALHLELELFNRRAAQLAAPGRGDGWPAHWPGPQMRVGVHTGPVFFADAGPNAGQRRTAFGETIHVARELEEMAPPGGVLASEAVRVVAAPYFEMAPFTAAPQGGPEGARPVRVLNERLDDRPWAPDLVAGRQTRLVGRDAELDQLDLAFQQAVDSRSMQVAVLAGEAGAGKARLIHEFEGRLRVFGDSRTVFRAAGLGEPLRTPFAALRAMMAQRFGIRLPHSPYVAAEKLHRALASSLGESRLREADVERLSRLLTARGAAALQPADVARSIRPVLEILAGRGPLLLLLDQTGDADEESLRVIDELLREPDGLPLLLVCNLNSDAPEAPGERFEWLRPSDDPFSRQTWLEMAPLSPVESRLVATGILSELSPLPMRLVDLIVAESRGNPLYIQEMVRFLIETGAIQTGARWQADMAAVESLRLPKGLNEMLALRLAHLPEDERLVLGMASALGMVFWDGALRQLQPFGDDVAADDLLDEVLAALTAKRLIRPDDAYSFGDAQAYSFSRPLLRRLIYDGLFSGERARYHQGAAAWLIGCQPEPSFSSWFPVQDLIGWHASRVAEREVPA